MSARNPILAGTFPDPSACRVGDTVYLVNSTFTWLPGLPIHASRDLENWELVGHALTEGNAGPLDLELGAESQGIFAPTLRHIGGRFVLVCTTVVGTTERSFVMTAPRAEGPWSTPRFLEGAGGIDPDVFEDEEGTVWWTGTRLAADPMWHDQTEIWTRPVDLDVARFTGEETVIWHGAVEKVVWSEGPHLYRVDGTYYLLTAEGGTAEEHSVSVARAAHPRGPWEGCKRNPIFTHRNLGRSSQIHNIGHADMFTMPDGSWWAVMLGVRLRGNRHLLGRETFLVPVSWEEGWPVFAPGAGRIPAALDVRPGIAPEQRCLAPLGDAPERPHELELPIAELSAKALRPVGAEWIGEEERSFRGVRAASWKAAISLAAETLAAGGLALGIVQDAKNSARVRIDEDGRLVARILARGEEEERVLGRPDAGARVRVGLRDLVCEIAFGDERAETVLALPAGWLSTEEAGGFTGCLLGLWGPALENTTAPVRLAGTELRP